MANWKKSLYIIIPLSFLFGLGWSYKTFRSHGLISGDYKASLQILSIEGLLSLELIDKFRIENKTDVQVTTAATPHELLQILQTSPKKFDAVTIFSYQVAAAKKIMRFHSGLSLPIDDLVHPDFQVLPIEGIKVDVGPTRFFPLLWGINGFAVQTKAATSEDGVSFDGLMQNAKTRPSDSPSIQMLRSSIEIGDWFTRTSTHQPIKSARADSEGEDESDPGPGQSSEFDEEQFRKTVGAIVPHVLFSDSAWRGNLDQKPLGSLRAIQMTNSEFVFFSRKQIGWSWKQTTDAKSTLWVLGFVANGESTRPDSLAKWFRYLLSGEVAQHLIATTHQASTSLAVDALALPPESRPSNLRSFRLSSFELTTQDPMADSFRSLLLKTK